MPFKYQSMRISELQKVVFSTSSSYRHWCQLCRQLCRRVRRQVRRQGRRQVRHQVRRQVRRKFGHRNLISHRYRTIEHIHSQMLIEYPPLFFAAIESVSSSLTVTVDSNRAGIAYFRRCFPLSGCVLFLHIFVTHFVPQSSKKESFVSAHFLDQIIRIVVCCSL